ncbi:hypothetical protein [Actinokineospora fastidiosa]|nr:hypothetical protein [Actinokineospora fastidiosa]
MSGLRTALAATVVAVLVLTVTTAALPETCSAQTSVGAPAAPPQAAPEAAALPADTAAGVVSAVRAVSPGADVGLLVWDSATESRMVAVEPSTRYQSASLVKLLVGIAATRAGTAPARVTRMLRDSDDRVASLLWGELGGDALPGRVAASLGIAGVGPPDIWGRWGNVLLSAEDLVTVYRYLLTDMPTLLTPLLNAPRTAADGFDQHFGIPSAFPGPWAVKQAWGTSAQATTAHTTGIVADRYVVVLLTSHPPGTSFHTATTAATAGATALAPHLP